MREICKYDPKRDLMDVQIGLDIDVVKAIENGEVLDGSGAMDYNGIEDPSLITGRCQDNFDVVDAQTRLFHKMKAAVDAKAAAAAKTPASTPSGEAD